MALINKYNVGDIVTVKSHPLFNNHKRIIEFSAQVPPLMMVKEVFFDDVKKKKIFSEELGGDFQLADLIKYTCIYFNANKGEFIEVNIYESFLNSYIHLKYFREIKDDNNPLKIEEDKQLIAEVSTYIPISKYEYGKVVQFKTKKLEQRKSYDGNSEKIANVSYQTPDFILSGIKSENITDAFYSDGNPKRKVSKELYKVLWFNHFQQKYSEQYLPKEFFVENIPF